MPRRPVKCISCQLLYYIEVPHNGECTECGSTLIVNVTEEEAKSLFMKAIGSNTPMNNPMNIFKR